MRNVTHLRLVAANDPVAPRSSALRTLASGGKRMAYAGGKVVGLVLLPLRVVALLSRAVVGVGRGFLELLRALVLGVFGFALLGCVALAAYAMLKPALPAFLLF